MTEEVNGRVPPAVAPERPEGRKYCDTCKFSQMIMGGGGLQMICRQRGPQVVGGVVVVNQGGQQTAQVVSQTLWCVVNREDWCPSHALAENARPMAIPANDSSIIQAS